MDMVGIGTMEGMEIVMDGVMEMAVHQDVLLPKIPAANSRQFKELIGHALAVKL